MLKKGWEKLTDAPRTVGKSIRPGGVHGHSSLVLLGKINKSNFLTIAISRDTDLLESIEVAEDLRELVVLDGLGDVADVKANHKSKIQIYTNLL